MRTDFIAAALLLLAPAAFADDLVHIDTSISKDCDAHQPTGKAGEVVIKTGDTSFAVDGECTILISTHRPPNGGVWLHGPAWHQVPSPVASPALNPDTPPGTHG